MQEAAGTTTRPVERDCGSPSIVRPTHFPDHVTLPARIQLHKSRRVDLSNHAAWAFIIDNNGYDPVDDEFHDQVVDDAIAVFPNETDLDTRG